MCKILDESWMIKYTIKSFNFVIYVFFPFRPNVVIRFCILIEKTRILYRKVDDFVRLGLILE